MSGPWADPDRGGTGNPESGPHPPENHKWLYISLEILVQKPRVQLLLKGGWYNPL